MHNKEIVRIFTQSLTINEYIKTTSNQFIEIYEKLFNLIFDYGFIPESWVVGNIIPIYKNEGDSNDPKNFRPITLVSCLGKLFRTIFSFSFLKVQRMNTM
jgi:hypothetical protein